ncbi:MAG: short-chain dehydrogenase/reductase [Ilumatobacteraceae bacterium]|nr:short-chain dehydrogenase/reductase [Ilumatobacteraceae bacterium]
MTDLLPFTSALVTGASSGIGQAMVRLLGEAGIPQVIVARRTDRLDELAAAYGNVEVLGADLSTIAGMETVADRIADGERPIDLVVNNAGFGTSGSFHELDPQRLDDEIAVNIRALTRLSRAALGVMVPRGRGYLLNVSSVVSFQPAPHLAVYGATKAYVTSLTESLHEEARGTGVHVTALCPGLTRTEFQSVSNTEHYSTNYPDFAWLEAADVARQALHDVAKGRALCVPGALYKTLAVATGVTPRGLARRLSGLVQRT